MRENAMDHGDWRPSSQHGKSPVLQSVSFKERLHHLTWGWFTLTMSSGGIALLLSVTPHRFHGLVTIGTIIYILDLVLFVALAAMILTRFTLFPGTFTASIKHPTESLFIGTFWLTLSTVRALFVQFFQLD